MKSLDFLVQEQPVILLQGDATERQEVRASVRGEVDGGLEVSFHGGKWLVRSGEEEAVNVFLGDLTQFLGEEFVGAFNVPQVEDGGDGWENIHSQECHRDVGDSNGLRDGLLMEADFSIHDDTHDWKSFTVGGKQSGAELGGDR